jgi:hypothetical protein
MFSPFYFFDPKEIGQKPDLKGQVKNKNIQVILCNFTP